MRILLFQTAYLGDLFLAIPLMRRIRRQFPGSHLTLVCRRGLGEPFRVLGLADEVIEADKRSRSGRVQALNQLRKQDWDYVFSPHESLRTALWVRSLKVHQGRVGFAHWWSSWAYNFRVEKPVERPDAIRQLALLSPFDREISDDLASDKASPVLTSSLTRKTTREFLNLEIPEWASMRLTSAEMTRLQQLEPEWKSDVKNSILIAPGSVWPTKRWSEVGFGQLCDQLLQRGEKLVLMGAGPAEVELAERLAAGRPGIINLAGRTSVLESLLLLSQVKALICNDSGAAHLASATGTPVLSIFGPTTLAQGFRPWTQRAMIVQKDLACRPCGRHGSKKCPIGTHECMQSIRAGEIMIALEELLAPQQL